MSAEPYYRRILADVRGRIAAGEWEPGDRLPSTRELVQFYRNQLQVPTLTAATVRHAINLLLELGELRGQQGVGVFVAGEDVPD
jgi:GntR family transcriptional regulator